MKKSITSLLAVIFVLSCLCTSTTFANNNESVSSTTSSDIGYLTLNKYTLPINYRTIYFQAEIYYNDSWTYVGTSTNNQLVVYGYPKGVYMVRCKEYKDMGNEMPLMFNIITQSVKVW